MPSAGTGRGGHHGSTAVVVLPRPGGDPKSPHGQSPVSDDAALSLVCERSTGGEVGEAGESVQSLLTGSHLLSGKMTP